MIFDTLDRIGSYQGISPELDAAIAFLCRADLSGLTDGRHEIDGTAVYANVSKPEFMPADQTKWEAHRRYADIHVPLADGETIGYLPLGSVGSWQPYNEAGDALLSEDPQKGHVLTMAKGSFVIFFPWDAHRPNQGSVTGKKMVVKVQVK